MEIPDKLRDLKNVRDLQHGDDRALDRIMSRWQAPLHKFAYHYTHNATDAQDLVAETFVRLYLNRQRLKQDTSLSGWLFTTLTNLCHNQHRWRIRHPTVSIEDRVDGVQNVNSGLHGDMQIPSEQLEHNEALQALHSAINGLPHDLKSTLLLHHYNRLSYTEIAKVMKCSVRGIETRLYRAKQKLRKILGAYLRDGNEVDEPSSTGNLNTGA